MPETVLTSDTIAVLQNRVSVRQFTDQPVSEAAVEAVLSAAFRAPTSSNIQAYSVIIVRDQQVKDALAPVTGNQAHVRATQVFLAFCADVTRLQAAAEMHGAEVGPLNMESCLVASIDAALVGQSAYLAADSIGLKGVMIGAVRNDAAKTAEILKLPKGVYCVFGMCLGYADTVPPQKPRMDIHAVTHRDTYGNQPGIENAETALAGYDTELAAHYRGTGRETTDASWTEDMGTRWATQPRKGLRGQLEEQGFDWG